MLANLRHFDETLPLDNDDACFKQATIFLKELMPDWNLSAVEYKLFTNGVVNKIFCCTEQQLKKKIIIRVYGPNTDLLIDRKKELTNWQRLSEKGYAAPLYATFNNGIVSGYQPGEVVNIESVKDPLISKKIAETMANMHRNVTKEGAVQPESCLFPKMREFIDLMPLKFDDPEKQKKFEQFPSRDELLTELADLQETIDAVKPPVVFCHNDLVIFNVLYDDKSDSVSFIDYEFADFNYQAFDIGNHFCEYAGMDAENLRFDRYPSREFQLVWLTNYLQCFLKRPPSEQEVERLFIQVNICAAAGHLLWSLCNITLANHSTIDFDYLSCSVAKYSEYLNLKRQYFNLKP